MNGSLYKINIVRDSVTISTDNTSTKYEISKENKLVKSVETKQAGGSVNYYEKYMKYKNKYLELRNQF